MLSPRLALSSALSRAPHADDRVSRLVLLLPRHTHTRLASSPRLLAFTASSHHAFFFLPSYTPASLISSSSSSSITLSPFLHLPHLISRLLSSPHLLSLHPFLLTPLSFSSFTASYITCRGLVVPVVLVGRPVVLVGRPLEDGERLRPRGVEEQPDVGNIKRLPWWRRRWRRS